MSCKEWLKLFGRDSEDKELKALLAKRGVKKVPAIKKHDTDTRVELDDGSMLIFSAPDLFPSRQGGGDGSSILSGLAVYLKDEKGGEYKGELPFNLQRADSQKALRKRLGEPRDQNEEFDWDEWEVDGLSVNVTYTKDRASLDSIVLSLPAEI